MKQKEVIELKSESYMEEQFLLDRFPSAVWLNSGSSTTFYLLIEEKDSVMKAMKEWEDYEKAGL
jgi:hypothetical protein